MKPKAKRQHRLDRHKRVRAKIQGFLKRPRVAVFKSNQYVYAQVIDDETGKTLVSVSNYGGKKSKTKTKSKKSEEAARVGEALAEKMKQLESAGGADSASRTNNPDTNSTYSGKIWGAKRW